MEAEHPLFMLYSSGSTAKPKGIVHTTGGYLTGVSATHRHVFDLDPERDVYFCTADVGWITGHSYIVYGPLANGAPAVMFEGAPDYPHKDIWWELVERYRVRSSTPRRRRSGVHEVGTRAPERRHDLSSLRLLGSVGEPINPKAWLWYHVVIGRERCPIVDTWWQTETGSDHDLPAAGLTETKPGSATPAARRARRRGRRGPARASSRARGCWCSSVRGRRCSARFTATERYVQTYFSRFGNDTYLVGDAAIGVTRTATSGSPGGSTT
jgi:acetyl-CoA synthetase